MSSFRPFGNRHVMAYCKCIVEFGGMRLFVTMNGITCHKCSGCEDWQTFCGYQICNYLSKTVCPCWPDFESSVMF